MELATFHSVWTLVLFIAFIGIILWAWSGRRRTDFEQAARMPLEDDEVAVLRSDHPPSGRDR